MMRVFLFIALPFLFFTGNDQQAAELLRHRASLITFAAGQAAISPRKVASIIYAERSMNIKPGEAILDVVLAKSGYNSSIGLAQVKVNTALWIEQQLHDNRSVFHLGPFVQSLLSKSRSRSELIERLIADSTNLLYAALYAAMIERFWGTTLESPLLVGQRVGIIATLYSLGVVRGDGSVRSPHGEAAMNSFGKKAQEFFDSFLLRDVFPK